MVKIYFLLIIISLLFTSCGGDKDYTVLSFPTKNKNFDDVFKIESTINVKTKNIDSIKIFSIFKLKEINSNEYLIVDAIGRSTYLIDSIGVVTKRISKPGQGPGELNYVLDFAFDDDGNLYLLDPIQNIIAMYDSSFKFIKNFHLSYEHRLSYELRYANGYFFISSQKNLDKNSTATNFSFLKYSENTFVMVYDKNFKLLDSFLNPVKEMLETEGVLALSRENFSPFMIHNTKIYTMTEEGFYLISIFNLNYKVVSKFEIESSKFKKIDLNRVKNIKIVNKKLVNSLEDIGNLVASYTTPVSLDALNDNLIISMQQPFGNYYPEFDKDVEKKYYYDIFKIENKGVKPRFSTIETEKRIVGVSQNQIYFVDKFGMHSDDYILIEKATLVK